MSWRRIHNTCDGSGGIVGKRFCAAGANVQDIAGCGSVFKRSNSAALSRNDPRADVLVGDMHFVQKITVRVAFLGNEPIVLALYQTIEDQISLENAEADRY